MNDKLAIWKPPVSKDSRKVDAALAKLRQAGALEEVRRPEKLETRRGQMLAPRAPISGEVVDLPRMCAVHDKPYVARYVMSAGGRFHYAQTIKVTQDLWSEQYQGNENARSVPSTQLGDEGCPWCGAHSVGWIGPVICSKCGAKVCFGRTARNYFRCRPSCNKEGYLRPVDGRENGLVPVQRTGSGGAF